LSPTTPIKIVQGRRLDNIVTDADFAVLPLGSIEYHGPHAPYGTDLILSEGFSEAIDGQFSAVLYPAVPYSACPGKTMHFKGTISISSETYLCYVQDILHGILKSGFSKIVILNAHDANMGVARVAAEWVTGQVDPSSVLILNWFQMLSAETTNDWGVFSGTGRGHGGPYEISAVQAFRPDSVQVQADDEDLATPPPLTSLPYVLVERSPSGWNGYTGKIHETSIESGHKIVQGVKQNLNLILEKWVHG